MPDVGGFLALVVRIGCGLAAQLVLGWLPSIGVALGGWLAAAGLRVPVARRVGVGWLASVDGLRGSCGGWAELRQTPADSAV